MGLLNREQILGADDLETEDVDVPEWGGTVRVRVLSGSERDAFEASIVHVRRDGARDFRLNNVRARFVALAIVDDKGARMFTEADVKALGRKSAAALERVWEVGRRLSGLTDKDVDELTEDFPDDPSDGSTSD